MSAAQPDAGPDLEELLLDTLDAVSRFRVGQREAVAAALDAGRLLALAKSRIPHGGFGEWLERVGVKPRTAQAWIRLAAMEVTVDDVIDRGGITATLAGRPPKSATVAHLESDTARELAAAEAEIAGHKAAYYAALTRRARLVRALAKEG